MRGRAPVRCAGIVAKARRQDACLVAPSGRAGGRGTATALEP
jgi:hypothetical protein